MQSPDVAGHWFAMYACSCTDGSAFDLCSKYFITIAYRAAYGMSINLLADPVNTISAFSFWLLLLEFIFQSSCLYILLSIWIIIKDEKLYDFRHIKLPETIIALHT